MKILDEDETLDAVVAGSSIARYGDGEFKLALGKSCISQTADKKLSQRLRDILISSGSCLIGLPRLGIGPKAEFWKDFTFDKLNLRCSDRTYGSSFITRPDSAPWINRDDYWEKIKSLWRNRDVTIVRGSTKSLTEEMLHEARSCREIIAPRQHAFHNYEDLMKRIGAPEVAILCVGPTATVMAVDLCAKGVHAIDFGHVGMFLRKHEKGLPMWVTKEEKAVDKS